MGLKTDQNSLSKFFYLVISGLFLGQGVSVVAQEATESEDIEYRTRGPVHEAFAQPVSFDPAPGPIVTEEPPAPIAEVPPEYKPEGENVVWIPGYWAWDESTSEFLWISGLWRIIPPDREWVSGYWITAEGGYRWVPGYWGDIAAPEEEYLPPPPDSIEEGPSSPAPAEDYAWVPGCWVWSTENYAWQPGYWLEPQPEWIWIPAHYQWTPFGCVFVDGYWDYEVIERGVLFSPVTFQASYYVAPQPVYVPEVIIDLNLFTDHLFCHSGYNRYYFGDYYGSDYHHRGFLPWFEFHLGHHGHDPLFSHRRAYHRRHHDRWEGNLQADHRHRERERSRRPSWRSAHRDGHRDGRRDRDHRGGDIDVGRRFREVAQNSGKLPGNRRFERLNHEQREGWSRRGREHEDREARRRIQTQVDRKPDKTPRVKIPQTHRERENSNVRRRLQSQVDRKPVKPQRVTEPQRVKQPQRERVQPRRQEVRRERAPRKVSSPNVRKHPSVRSAPKPQAAQRSQPNLNRGAKGHSKDSEKRNQKSRGGHKGGHGKGRGR